MKLYNTLTKTKEEFKPIYTGKVGMYVCGPTVYDHCHIGHARGYVSMDVFRKYLEYLGYEVRFIMNYTDVGHLVNDAEIGEDKIEKKAKAEKIDPMEIVENYINSAKEDFKSLNIKPANFNPRPTQYIAQIIKFIEGLIEKEYAYESNGSVYFSVAKFPQYGKLSGRKTEELIEGSRIENNPEKKNQLDFALWIKSDENHILKWKSPWSLGYPGWHIECSVMSADLLGQDTFDIHGGGNENVFPHNENEVAQSEAYLGKKMANYWTLWNMVNINGEKMSKSKGNHTSVKDILKEYDPMVIRLWILSSQYRSVINYTPSVLVQAKVNLEKITDWVRNLKNVSGDSKGSTFGVPKVEPLENSEKIDFSHIYQKRFEEAMNDDLNTPLALSIVYELITETNKLMTENKLSADSAKNILSFWEKINKVFGLIIKEEKENIPEEIVKLAEERKLARENKDFQKSDELRKKIEEVGYIIEDLKDNNYLIKI
ncbi:MAG: cysteine--tRNA ligase [Candidatus Moranbacteria bacterium RIFOXYA12_FULL_35_19]|nr:MAG: cysteine--tRNA ligase [Candidatus Moranbacteria bacterium RIFOXYB12_FULL_35_8]OGI33302.1 MAG: cysteine--tRNA ligase [Candidatus Moranbacteria bacterium RIFOXYC12_FULL_36_13]OGI36820.1 MAG: cysteine--tRNA ligase [Candidatus Moranbacteria bacterium RIFOXYA12_FULL_35_19]